MLLINMYSAETTYAPELLRSPVNEMVIASLSVGSAGETLMELM